MAGEGTTDLMSDLAVGVGASIDDLTECVADSFCHKDTSPFWSPNELDSNMECANVTDGLFAIARAIDNLADVLRVK